MGNGGRGRKLRHTVRDPSGPKIHSQPVVMKEVCSNDRLLDVCMRNDKDKLKPASQSQADS